MNLNPAKAEFTATEHGAIREKIAMIRAEQPIAQAQISRESGVPESMLSSYLRDRYNGDNNIPAAGLHRWIESRERAMKLRNRRPVAPSFQALPTSQRILGVLDTAREMGRIVTITGDPGTSKTATARAFCRDTPRAWLATMKPSTAGVQPMLLAILAAMGEADAKGSPQMLSERIESLATQAQSIIVMDESQHLSDKSIDQLRAINDTARAKGALVGIALLGNEGIMNRIGGTGSRAAFAQISSRIAMRRKYEKPDPADVAMLAQAWAEANNEILTKPELDFVQKVAARPGGLRNVEMMFEAALLVCLENQEPLALDHLQGAFGQLSGLNLAA